MTVFSPFWTHVVEIHIKLNTLKIAILFQKNIWTKAKGKFQKFSWWLH